MRLDRYILFEWAKVFLLSILAILGILLISDIQNDMHVLLSYGAGTYGVIKYYLILLPSFIPVVLPISFMVSLLFALGQFHKNMEITAMRSAGLSLWKITRSLWYVGFILMGVMFYLNAKLVPWSIEQSREIWNNHRFAKELEDKERPEEIGLIYNLTFFNHADKRMWFLNRFNQYNFRAYGITVSGLNEAGQESSRIVANEGYFEEGTNRWVFLSGREIEFAEGGQDAVRSLPFERREMRDFHEDPKLMKYLEKDPEDLSITELGTILLYIKPEDNPRINKYAVMFYDRLFNPISCLIVVGLAIPSALGGVRTNALVGVSKAMGWFVLYYLFVSVGQFLGNAGLNPIIAAGLPNILAGLLLFFLYQRFRHPV